MSNYSLISDIIVLPKSHINNIENLLKQRYGTILRWAIVSAESDLKIAFTYKKEVL